MGSTKKFVEGKWRYVHDDGTLGMPCSPPTEAEIKAAEDAAQRRKFQAQADETGKEVWWRGERFLPTDPTAAAAIAAKQPKLPPGAKVYKVLTQRDEWFMGKFSPEKLESAVNHYAADGWRVVGIATADVGAWWGSFAGGMRQEIVVFLERSAE